MFKKKGGKKIHWRYMFGKKRQIAIESKFDEGWWCTLVCLTRVPEHQNGHLKLQKKDSPQVIFALFYLRPSQKFSPNFVICIVKTLIALFTLYTVMHTLIIIFHSFVPKKANFNILKLKKRIIFIIVQKKFNYSLILFTI